MRLTTPHGISSPPFRFQGELCLWLLKKCYPCLRYTCYLCLQSIQGDIRGGSLDSSLVAAFAALGSSISPLSFPTAFLILPAARNHKPAPAWVAPLIPCPVDPARTQTLLRRASACRPEPMLNGHDRR